MRFLSHLSSMTAQLVHKAMASANKEGAYVLQVESAACLSSSMSLQGPEKCYLKKSVVNIGGMKSALQ
jgi:hypothetical protein